MNKFVIVILIVSILGNMIGLYFAYKFRKVSYQARTLQSNMNDAGRIISDLTDKAESGFTKRLIFLHHSVGQGLLEQGGLRDSLTNMGIFVKGATYGDDIGQRTDLCDWFPKFSNDFDRILKFKNHPNVYYEDGRRNDVIVFKSCYPNAYVESEGAGSGSPTDPGRTTQNYRAVFENLSKEFRKYPDKLFIYMTYPPLVPAETNLDAAKRAREFNQWLIRDFQPRYHKETGLQNFYVFDLFDVLADKDNFLRSEYRSPSEHDSHPNVSGSREATLKFLEFFHPIWNEWSSKLATSSRPGTAKVSS